MIDGSSATRATVNGPFGTDAVIDGNDLRVVADLDGGTQLIGDMIERTGPSALALASDVTEINPVTGNDGDTITILERNFTILSMDPDGCGGVILYLEEAS